MANVEQKETGKLLEGFKNSTNAREPFERQWRMNLAWLLGKHYVLWHKSQKRLYEPSAPSWRVRLVVNRIFPIWRSNLGRLLKTRPLPDAIPASGDEQDVLTAKVADKLIKYIWKTSDLDGHRSIELYGWMLAAGCAFTQQWWDPDAGELLSYPEVVEPKELMESPEKALQNMGEITVSVVPPFEIYPDPAATSMDNLNWMWHAKAVHIDILKERYPEKASNISADSSLETMVWPFDTQAVSGTFGSGSVMGAPQLKEHTLLKEYYEKPSKKFRKGRHAIFAGDTFIKLDEELPNDSGTIPLTKFDYVVFPGRFWGGSFIEQIIPINQEYNRTRSQIIESKNMLSKPKLLVPITAEISSEAFTSEPGEKITYNPLGGRPEPWVPPPIPGYVLQELERNEQDMMEVSSYHWISRGMNPPGVRTAAGLALLQEADDTPIGPVLLWNEASWRQVGEHIIELGKQHYTEPRTAYMGIGNEAEVIEFHRNKLQGKYKVRVDMGSALPMSRAAKMQFALELLNHGGFRDESNKIDEAKFFKFLEMETAIDIFQEDNLDIRIARTENVEMRDRLTIFEPGEYDNHVVHLDQHVRFMKELNLEVPGHKAIAPDENGRSLMADHIHGHELRIRENELKRAEEQLALESGIAELKAAIAPNLPESPEEPPEAPESPPTGLPPGLPPIPPRE